MNTYRNTYRSSPHHCRAPSVCLCSLPTRSGNRGQEPIEIGSRHKENRTEARHILRSSGAVRRPCLWRWSLERDRSGLIVRGRTPHIARTGLVNRWPYGATETGLGPALQVRWRGSHREKSGGSVQNHTKSTNI